MADLKISQLPAAAGDLADDDLLVYVDTSAGVTEKVELADFAAWLTGVRKVNVKTASHTIGWADLGAFVPIDSSSATDWTIPPNSSVAFPVGAEIEGGQRGTGIVTVVAGSGVTLESEDNAVVSRGRYARWVATQVAVDVWWLAGALV